MRLLQGDCLQEMDKLIEEGVRVDAIICDPPFGTTNCSWDSVIPLNRMWEKLNSIKHNSNTPIILNSQQPFTTSLIASNISNFKYCWYWEKERLTNITQVKKRAGKTIEEVCIFYDKPCLYNPQMIKYYGKKRTNKVKNGKMGKLADSGEKKVKEYNDTGFRYPTQVLKFKRDILTSNLHPTQKPVKLMEYLIKTYTNEGETVLDFTMGSGTTGVASVNTGRNFIGIELDKGYFKIAENRIKKAQKERELAFFM